MFILKFIIYSLGLSLILTFIILKYVDYITYYQKFKWNYELGQIKNPYITQTRNFITYVVIKNKYHIYTFKKVLFKIIHANELEKSLLLENKYNFSFFVYGAVRKYHFIICDPKNNNIIYNPDNIYKFKTKFIYP